MFRARPNDSIRAVVKALDRLTGTAIRYGPGGKHVFMQNLKSCRVVDLLLGSGGIELMSEPLGPELNHRLEQVLKEMYPEMNRRSAVGASVQNRSQFPGDGYGRHRAHGTRSRAVASRRRITARCQWNDSDQEKIPLRHGHRYAALCWMQSVRRGV
jgi:hypothetical protein